MKKRAVCLGLLIQARSAQKFSVSQEQLEREYGLNLLELG